MTRSGRVNERQQPTARAEHDAVHGGPAGDHQLIDVPGGVLEPGGQDRVAGRVGEEVEELRVPGDLAVPLKPALAGRVIMKTLFIR
jgi:hypothetical protein